MSLHIGVSKNKLKSLRWIIFPPPATPRILDCSTNVDKYEILQPSPLIYTLVKKPRALSASRAFVPVLSFCLTLHCGSTAALLNSASLKRRNGLGRDWFCCCCCFLNFLSHSETHPQGNYIFHNTWAEGNQKVKKKKCQEKPHDIGINLVLCFSSEEGWGHFRKFSKSLQWHRLHTRPHENRGFLVSVCHVLQTNTEALDRAPPGPSWISELTPEAHCKHRMLLSANSKPEVVLCQLQNSYPAFWNKRIMNQSCSLWAHRP